MRRPCFPCCATCHRPEKAFSDQACRRRLGQGQYSDTTLDTCTELQFLTRSSHSMSGAFKVPGLRNVAQTAPYFHDGRIATLEAVIDYCAKTSQQPKKDNDLPAIQLTDTEQQDLIAFLKML
ncbi:c-type cytochrome [Thiothrix litoralis]|uniref:C-type cytochrome n=1 Tax=Thiothrix litoralis TaxID=2891210 RepID=A0ABX7X145_9GAMM|nr:cytochrome c peroxidase [Thiothrix litoralis]QTR48493.1 c-type cytochrome [Thiothrix litoralis]